MTKYITEPDTGEILGISTRREPPFLRTRYNYDMHAAGKEAALHCPEPTLAQQSGKDDADINTLVRRFGVTGTMPMLDRIPLQDEFLEITDFQTAANALLSAQEEFQKLPSDIRRRFDNDPHEFMNFTSDEKNREELDKMGLLKPKTAPQGPIEVRVVPDPQPVGEKPPAT